MRRIALVALELALLVPASAAAQRPGLYVDPNSPTGKQYQIPLETARRQADPRGDGRAPPGGRPTGTNAAQLFGAGIVTKRPGKQSARDGAGASTGSSRDTDRQGSPSSRGLGASRSRRAVQAAVSSPGAPSGGIASTLLIVGGGGLVLLVGGLAGIAMRRRSAG